MRGDHSQCRHRPQLAPVVPAPSPDADDFDAPAELAALAGRLRDAYAADPGNATLARELRLTLLAMTGPSGALDAGLTEFSPGSTTPSAKKRVGSAVDGMVSHPDAIRWDDVTMDLTGWSPVTDAGGKLLGYMAPADAETPHETALRRRVARVRAGKVGEVAAMLGEECFDVNGVFDTARAAGVPETVLDSAGYLAVELTKIESGRA